MNLLDLYYDHYKETCELNRDIQKRRNNGYILLCVLEAFSFLLLLKPALAFAILQSRVDENVCKLLITGNGILQTLVWILIIYILIRYCQDMLNIERQYIYLERLEKEICSLTTSNVFRREGVGYVVNYPIVLNFIDIFYKTISPILFQIINSIRIYNEYYDYEKSKMLFFCDSVIYFMTTLIIWFYFFEIHGKTSEYIKSKIKWIDWLSDKIHSLLKEV